MDARTEFRFLFPMFVGVATISENKERFLAIPELRTSCDSNSNSNRPFWDVLSAYAEKESSADDVLRHICVVLRELLPVRDAEISAIRQGFVNRPTPMWTAFRSER